MPVTEEQRQEIVDKAIREISHIATLPKVTLRIIELVEDPTSTAQDLHAVISNDPALSSRILKVVNSSFYGLPGQISSINRAIVMLGLNAVKNIAIAASLAKLFRGGELTPNFSAKELWNHSNATAIGCKLISDTCGMGLGDEAYLAGLIHDIGIMVEMQYDRSKLIDAIDKTGAGVDGVPRVSLLETEAEVFGANHQQFGQGLCAKWKFPAPFAAATGYHHNPAAAPTEQKKLVAVVHASDCLAGRLANGFRPDNPTCNMQKEIREMLKLSEEKIDELTSKLQVMVTDADNLI